MKRVYDLDGDGGKNVTAGKGVGLETIGSRAGSASEGEPRHAVGLRGRGRRAPARRLVLAGIAVTIVLAAFGALPVADAGTRELPRVGAAGQPFASASAPAAQADSSELSVYRVTASSEAAAQRLLKAGFDVLEDRSGASLFVLGDHATAAKLRASGFPPTVVEKLKPATWQAPSTRLVPQAPSGTTAAGAPVDETYDGGYHTVNAQYAHLDAVASAHPDLATVVDYGDSYLKTRNPRTGYDLKAICLTHKRAGDCTLNPKAKKPRFLLMTQIHAREIVTGDVSWRFINHLVNDATDSTVSALLDTTEVWVVPVANPDGVDRVQQGGNHPYLQRKNLHGTGCEGFGQPGVDLNRNTVTHWNTTGADADRCDLAYPGPRADSEPETTAIESLFRHLFADQRGPGDSAVAPATTRGAMISLHAAAGMNLFPWGWSNRHAPNYAKLRAIAAKMSSYNGYEYGQPGELLYNASGTSDDWSYGELGIASFTVELASCEDFTPAYSCTAIDFAKNLPALMYVASIAKAPYR